MVVCPNCGRESNQPGASYCLYCGASLTQPKQAGPMTPAVQAAPYAPSAVLGSERYKRALAKVERLGGIVAVLAVVTLILVLV